MTRDPGARDVLRAALPRAVNFRVPFALPATSTTWDAIADELAAALEAPRLTHGRHCPCGSCRRQDWTDPKLAHCGMHGPSCPAVYDPVQFTAST